MAAHTTNTVPRMVSDMLDLSFVTEWSDDEGIGSDVSLENSEQSSSNGTLNNTDTLKRQARQLVKIPKRNISVKKFVKILRRSVGTGNSETVSTEVVPSPDTVSECQFQSQRVFGVDLTEHLDQTSCLVPRIVEFCCEIIQEHGLTDGVYRLSGQSSHIVNLKREFEGGKVPGRAESRSRDTVHAVASLLKLYFRSLPEPLLTFSLYQDFIQAAKFSLRYQVSCLRKLVSRLPRAHLSTLTHLMRHLHHLAAQHTVTGMTSRNLAIVWAPNLLRPNNQDCLRDCGLQALVVEALIVYFEEIVETESESSGCVTKKNFTKEVSIDQAVARAESFKPKTPERRMVRSISCVSTLKTPGLETADIDRRLQGSRFQSRGVHLKRDRSLNCENNTRHRQLPARPAPASAPVLDARQPGQEAGAEHPGSPGYGTTASVTARLGPRTRSEIFTLDTPHTQAGEDDTGASEAERLRSSRTRLKERLNWFSSRSRQRLSSFGSSDNLKYVREGFLRSRDKLSSTLSPMRGRIGSYHFVDSEMKNCPSQGSICVRVGMWQ